MNKVPWLLFLVVCLTLQAHPAGASQPVPLQLALNWKAEPQFGGFYNAQLSGEFDKRGLEVAIIEGGAGTPVVQMIASGKVIFGIAAADEVVISQSRGTDVIALFAVYQINPQGVMVHPERGFKSIADVFASRGTLAMQLGAPFTLFLQSRFRNARVKLVPYTGGIGPFLNDPNHSQQCFVTAEPLQVKRKSRLAQSFLIADTGFNPYATVVIARRRYVDENERLVRDFINAVRLGWIQYLESPDQANLLMVKLNPSMDVPTMQESAEVQKAHIVPDGAAAETLGMMSRERWVTLIDQLAAIKLIKKKPAVERLFRNF